MLDLSDMVGPRRDQETPPTSPGTGLPGLGSPASDGLCQPASASRLATANRLPPSAARDPWTQILAAMLVMLLALLAVRFLMPIAIEHARYAWHRGQLRAEYEVAGERIADVSLASLGTASRLVSQRVGPSVVHIDVVALVSLENESSRLLAMQHAGQVVSPEQGSGVVVDADGYILTNEHVVADASEIAVTLSDGRRLPAELIGRDRLTDLALLKIEATDLMPVAWADSDKAEVGDPVWALGSPFGLNRTVTFGILSGKHRVLGSRREQGRRERGGTAFQDFMQSDVAVNPGNSGGPLVDDRGMLVGINTAIVGKLYSGVSFAIPSNVAQTVYEQLRAAGRVERGWLGVQLADDPSASTDNGPLGVTVEDYAADESPAARAGLLRGDQIVRFNGSKVAGKNDLMRRIAESPAGSEVQLLLRRRGRLMELPVTLGVRPAESVQLTR
jgi:serine protease Do